MEMTAKATPPTNRPRRKGGRPPLPAAERRDFQYTIHFNELELGNLERRAQAAGLQIPTFIRVVALGVDMPYAIPQINKDALAYLGKIGVLLNQIAKHLNSGIGTDQDLANLDTASKALAGLQTRIFDARPKMGRVEE